MGHDPLRESRVANSCSRLRSNCAVSLFDTVRPVSLASGPDRSGKRNGRQISNMDGVVENALDRNRTIKGAYRELSNHLCLTPHIPT